MSRTPNASDLVEERVVATLRQARFLQPEGKTGIPPGVRNMVEMTALAFFGLGSVWMYLANKGPIGKAVIVASIVIAPAFRIWTWLGKRDDHRVPSAIRSAESSAPIDQPASVDEAGFDPDAIMARYMAGRDATAEAEPAQTAPSAPRRAFGRKPA